jgi:hypothetical protein
VVPAVAQGVLCGGDPLIGASLGYLSHCPWGPFLWPLLLHPETSPNGFHLNNLHVFINSCLVHNAVKYKEKVVVYHHVCGAERKFKMYKCVMLLF